MDPLVVKMMPLCKWPIFSMSLVTVPQVSAKVNSIQFPSRFFEWRIRGEFA